VVDRTRYGLHRETVDALARDYVPQVVTPAESAVEALDRGDAPFAVCFDFDYPATSDLADLQEMKQARPSVPIVMVTEQHSESLAVWAFRTRVWDYFVVPLDLPRFLSVFERLAGLHGQATPRAVERRAARPVVAPECPLPAEVRFGEVSAEKQTLNLALAHIDRHLHERVQQREVAELCGLSPSQLSRAFQRTFGVSFQDYVVQRRVQEALRLLANPRATVAEVCYAVGFQDHSYFTRTFRRLVGCTPSSYVRSVRADARAQAQAAARPPNCPRAETAEPCACPLAAPSSGFANPPPPLYPRLPGPLGRDA
jgi:AraC-like DNA-binding protein